MQSTQHEANH